MNPAYIWKMRFGVGGGVGPMRAGGSVGRGGIRAGAGLGPFSITGGSGRRRSRQADDDSVGEELAGIFVVAAAVVALVIAVLWLAGLVVFLGLWLAIVIAPLIKVFQVLLVAFTARDRIEGPQYAIRRIFLLLVLSFPTAWISGWFVHVFERCDWLEDAPFKDCYAPTHLVLNSPGFWNSTNNFINQMRISYMALIFALWIMNHLTKREILKLANEE
jgi:hypothetical protein